MLKQRVITALVLVSLLLVALLAENPVYWRALISVALLLSFWEWLRFCRISSMPLQGLCFAVFLTALLLLQSGFFSLPLIIISSCILWLVLLIFTLTRYLDFLHQPLPTLLIGVWVLATAGHLVIEFKPLENGRWWVLCFMASVFAADIGAYFVGRRFGKTKLAAAVSPGKTVEGLFGGLGFVVLLFIPILMYLFELQQAILLLIAILLTSLVSVGGDLFISKQKRHAGLKDSSQILPGHGGVLDRIDSLLSGAPIFALGLLVLGIMD